MLVAARRNAVAARTFFTKHAEVDSSPPEVATDWAPAYPRGVGGTRFSIFLSSRSGGDLGWFLVCALVTEHGPHDVDATAGEGEDGLAVAFACLRS